MSLSVSSPIDFTPKNHVVSSIIHGPKLISCPNAVPHWPCIGLSDLDGEPYHERRTPAKPQSHPNHLTRIATFLCFPADLLISLWWKLLLSALQQNSNTLQVTVAVFAWAPLCASILPLPGSVKIQCEWKMGTDRVIGRASHSILFFFTGWASSSVDSKQWNVQKPLWWTIGQLGQLINPRTEIQCSGSSWVSYDGCDLHSVW